MTKNNGVKTLLLTRPEFQARRFACGFAARAERQQIRIVCAPLMQINAVKTTLPTDRRAHVFTSENAVRSLPPEFSPSGRPAFCVGERTARAAEEAGYRSVSVRSTAADLLAQLQARRENTGLLYLSGAHLASDLLLQLPGLQRQIIYTQAALPPDPQAEAVLAGEEQVILPLFSPRSARLFCDNYPRIQARITIVAISAATAHALKDKDTIKIIIAAHPDGDNMKTAVNALI